METTINFCVVFAGAFIIATVLTQTVVLQDKDTFAAKPCTTDQNCTDEYNHTQCVSVKLTSTNKVEKRCRCDVASNFYMRDDTKGCILNVALGRTCAIGQSLCTTKNAACQRGYSLTPLYRCLCKIGFVPTETTTGSVKTHECAAILTTNNFANCSTCEANDGKCYAKTGNPNYGCQCPASRSGVNCEKIHVNVTCDVSTFKMKVCYEPHGKYNFSNGAMLFSNGHGNDEACKGKVSNTCGAGNVMLLLDMKEKLRDRCGTARTTINGNLLRYYNKLIVQSSPQDTTASALIFSVYCAFEKSKQHSFNPVVVQGVAGNSRGEHKKPKLTFNVLNTRFQVLSDNSIIGLGDLVKFEVVLAVDGTYSAIRVDSCAASDKPTMPYPNTIPTWLIENQGCPAKGQNYITKSNNFQAKAPNRMLTNNIKIFKMPTSSTLFIHCLVKLCLLGEEAKCALKNCTANRKRRAAGDPATSGDVQVSRRITIGNPVGTVNGASVGTLSSTNFIVLIVSMIAVVLIFMLISVLLMLRSRRKQKPADAGTDRPQRFAIPRINRNNVRF